jgi:hypothetical protein
VVVKGDVHTAQHCTLLAPIPSLLFFSQIHTALTPQRPERSLLLLLLCMPIVTLQRHS